MCGFINNFFLGDNMIESIKFCLLMTISKILSAMVTAFIVLGLPIIVGSFYLVYLIDRDVESYLVTMVIPVIGLILLPFCAKLSLYCFRCALAIGDKTKIIEKKPGKKQGE